MKRPVITFIGVALILGAVAIIWQPLLTFLAVDSCLDAGGSFNYMASSCDFERSHPFITTDNTARFVVAVALAILGVTVTITGRYVRRNP